MFAAWKFAWYAFPIITGLLTHTAFAEDPSIFDVRKNLAMSEDEPVYRDFYINGGVESGIQKGMIINVRRKVTLYDSIQNRSPGELLATVAQVKVIHVQKGLSVARLYQETNREAAPLLEDDFIMIGDHLDIRSAFMEPKKSARSGGDESAGKRAGVQDLKLEIKAQDFSSFAPQVKAEEVDPSQANKTVPALPAGEAKASSEPVGMPSFQ